MVTILSEMQADSGLYLSLSALLLLYPSGLTADCCWYSSSIFSAWSGCGALWSYLYISDQNPWIENRIDFLPKSLNWEQDRCWAILRDLQTDVVEWEYVVTCESNTARWDAWSLWHWPVTRVLKGSKQLPIKNSTLAEPFCQILRQRGSHEPRLLDISMISNRFSWIRLYLETNRLSTDGWRDRYDPVTNVTFWFILVAWWLE